MKLIDFIFQKKIKEKWIVNGNAIASRSSSVSTISIAFQFGDHYKCKHRHRVVITVFSQTSHPDHAKSKVGQLNSLHQQFMIPLSLPQKKTKCSLFEKHQQQHKNQSQL